MVGVCGLAGSQAWAKSSQIYTPSGHIYGGNPCTAWANGGGLLGYSVILSKKEEGEDLDEEHDSAD
jgi:hypothetical protein